MGRGGMMGGIRIGLVAGGEGGGGGRAGGLGGGDIKEGVGLTVHRADHSGRKSWELPRLGLLLPIKPSSWVIKSGLPALALNQKTKSIRDLQFKSYSTVRSCDEPLILSPIRS
jgi:hypothetical protein